MTATWCTGAWPRTPRRSGCPTSRAPPDAGSAACRWWFRLAPAARAGFLEGLRAYAPSTVGMLAWGLVTGVAMARSGLSTPQALGMSLLVFAGSAQLAALPLMAAGLPIWAVLATAAAVNLRFVIFSASIRPYFQRCSLARRVGVGYLNGDISFVLFMRRYPQPRREPGEEGFFYGVSLANWAAWHVASVAGILLAAHIPEAWGASFAGTLTLISVLLPLAASRSGAATVAVAAAAAVATRGLPYRLHLVAPVLAAVAVGVALDEWSGGAAGDTGQGVIATGGDERQGAVDGEELAR